MIVVLNLAILEDFFVFFVLHGYPQLIHRVFIINTKILTLTIFPLPLQKQLPRDFQIGT